MFGRSNSIMNSITATVLREMGQSMHNAAVQTTGMAGLGGINRAYDTIENQMNARGDRKPIVCGSEDEFGRLVEGSYATRCGSGDEYCVYE